MDVVTVYSVVETSIAKDSRGPVISLLSVIKNVPRILKILIGSQKSYLLN